jgi:2-phosphosulfolactate phosphatase
MNNKPFVEVCLTPVLFDLHKSNAEIIVVIDVLRATSAICAAFDNGIEALIPVTSIEEAKEYQQKGYLVGAERKGQIVEGFDFGNSPYSYMKDELKGKTVVLSTTNGTKSINIAKPHGQVVIGALSNIDVLNEWLLKQNKNVLCLCSGWQDKMNLEDSMCAGAITEALLESGKFQSEQDSSITAMYMYKQAKDSYFGFLKNSSHRRRLQNLNLSEDIKYCLTPNKSTSIPILVGDKLTNYESE